MMVPKRFNFELTKGELVKLKQLGGGRWLRKAIREAEPPVPLEDFPGISIPERDARIILDLRPAKLIAEAWKISPKTVYAIRCIARKKGKTVVEFEKPKESEGEDDRGSGYQIRRSSVFDAGTEYPR